MNTQFPRQAQDMFNAVKDARIPDIVQTVAEQSVAQARETYDRINLLTKDNARILEEVLEANQAGVRVIGEKVFNDTRTNVESAFDTARAIARAATISEAAELQAKYLKEQLAVGSKQAKDLFELATKVTRQAFDKVAGVVSNASTRLNAD